MFDKLVESTSTGADVKPRRRIFAATLVLVATLFATAVVASIYAADYDLGASNFDIAELLTPVTETEPPAPEPEPRQRRSNLPQSADNQPTRQILMESTAEATKVPDKISTDVNPYASTKYEDIGKVRIGMADTDPGGHGGTPNEGGTGSNPGFTGETANNPAEKAPPPVAPKVEKKTISGGAMAGKATNLPKPAYSALAKAAGAQGPVAVQILVDETGRVVSAKAVSGHPMLRPAAVDAAWKAKFDPATLSGVPVKVTGIITYNFTKN